MHQAIEGIYLGHISYSETSVIAHFYTRSHGRQSFLCKGVKSKKGKIALLQPFTILELVCNFNATKDLQLCTKFSSLHPLSTIATDLRKSCVALFITEILHKSLHENVQDERLYQYLKSSILLFDNQPFSANTHLIFLLQLSKHLGFFPKYKGRAQEIVFNLLEGDFESMASKEHFLDKETSQVLIQLLNIKLSESEQLTIAPQMRKQLLKGIVTYFEIQLHGAKIKSLEVLETIFE